jgi:SAM-dependent methyltransferase
VTLTAATRDLIKRSYLATCAALYLRNQIDALRFRLGRIETESGTPHSRWTTDEAVDYIFEVFNDYKMYGAVDRFSGRGAEIGPGDNCGVGLMLLADGCCQVDLADRYYSRRNPRAQAAIYRKLAERCTQVGRLLHESDLEDENTFPGIRRFYGAGAAAEEFFKTHRGYDFILSRAVGEHLYDPLMALKAMSEALNPDGVLLHKVDLRDHELFSDFHHELKWLEVPQWLYSRMTLGSGRPNRVLVHEYARMLEALDVDWQILITRLSCVGDIIPHLAYEAIDPESRFRAEAFVNRHRPKFARTLRSVESADLAVAGIFIVARKRS